MQTKKKTKQIKSSLILRTKLKTRQILKHQSVDQRKTLAGVTNKTKKNKSNTKPNTKGQWQERTIKKTTTEDKV